MSPIYKDLLEYLMDCGQEEMSVHIKILKNTKSSNIMGLLHGFLVNCRGKSLMDRDGLLITLSHKNNSSTTSPF